MKRKTPLKAKSGFKAKPKKLKPGKKTNEWAKVRADLKIEFERLGISSCELMFEGCWRDNSLGFAHAKKRRKLSPEELRIVILACNPCHDKIEYLPAEEMEAIVLGVIDGRRK